MRLQFYLNRSSRENSVLSVSFNGLQALVSAAQGGAQSGRTLRLYQPEADAAEGALLGWERVAVGTRVTPRPPPQIPASGTTAPGSYLESWRQRSDLQARDERVGDKAASG